MEYPNTVLHNASCLGFEFAAFIIRISVRQLALTSTMQVLSMVMAANDLKQFHSHYN
jgi:hypothetical protein